jgi:cold shock CspA family protein
MVSASAQPVTGGLRRRDVFVHHSAIKGNRYRSLREGARVSYAEEQGDKAQKMKKARVGGPSHILDVVPAR